MESIATPARASVHATTEFEFHISPACSSSRPHTGVGIVASTSSTRARRRGIVGDPDRIAHCRVEVGDRSAPPPAHLVAEHPPAAEPPHAHRPRCHHTARARRGAHRAPAPARPRTSPSAVRTISAAWNRSQRGPALPPGQHRLEQPAAPPHHVGAGAQGDPVEVDHRRALRPPIAAEADAQPGCRSSRRARCPAGQVEVDEAVGLAGEAHLLHLDALLGEAARVGAAFVAQHVAPAEDHQRRRETGRATGRGAGRRHRRARCRGPPE